MTEWLYILEINPGSRIKAGRTSSLGNRLVTHTAAAGFGRGELSRVYSIACNDVVAAEVELLAALKHQPGAVLVHGRETFEGVGFRRAVALAESIAEARRPSRVGASPLPEGLLADCVAAFGEDSRVHLEELRSRLAATNPSAYGHLAVHTLGSALRDVGISSFQLWRAGRNRQGVGLADFTTLAEAS